MNKIQSKDNGNVLMGEVNAEATELCFVQYLPIKLAGSDRIEVPRNLLWVMPILFGINGEDISPDSYVYLTAKHLNVTPSNTGTRPGWHIDGYGSEDINYIWYNKYPTVFSFGHFELSEDHEESMKQMENYDHHHFQMYMENSLLRLDNTLVHCSPTIYESGLRTFVKVSISKHRYNLEGNAHNYLFDYDWKMYPRSESRNHPYVID